MRREICEKEKEECVSHLSVVHDEADAHQFVADQRSLLAGLLEALLY
jgi:hypothetical protein